MDDREVLQSLISSGKLTKREKAAVSNALDSLTWPLEAGLDELVTDCIYEKCPDEFDKGALKDAVVKELKDDWYDIRLIRKTVDDMIGAFRDAERERKEDEWTQRRTA